ncbi:MAG: Glutamine cyclotransferase [Methanosaeta sp. PtaU1.Bin060]|nr:MAG: Glutamine cyclotransferase [Methanosaeta sp. PtaU1.Bin060]
MKKPGSSLAALLVIVLQMMILSEAQSEMDPGGAEAVPIYGYKIVDSYPHDASAFTEGLVYEKGELYEGTGLYRDSGPSTLRRVDLQTGKVQRQIALDGGLFGEGVTIWDDRLIQLTYKDGIGLVYGKENLTEIDKFSYGTEGWGLTSDGLELIMSDGTENLHLLDPETFEERGRLQVRIGGVPLRGINELEYVRGEIFANIWPTDWIAIISPKTGNVTGLVDLQGILPKEDSSRVDVLNGIAYDEEKGRLFVTGKLWPRLFEIELVKHKDVASLGASSA